MEKRGTHGAHTPCAPRHVEAGLCRAGVIQNHNTAPNTEMTLPTAIAHCHPTCSPSSNSALAQAAMAGVTIGAIKPPALPPVLQMPAAVPPCRPPSSTAEV